MEEWYIRTKHRKMFSRRFDRYNSFFFVFMIINPDKIIFVITYYFEIINVLIVNYFLIALIIFFLINRYYLNQEFNITQHFDHQSFFSKVKFIKHINHETYKVVPSFYYVKP